MEPLKKMLEDIGKTGEKGENTEAGLIETEKGFAEAEKTTVETEKKVEETFRRLKKKNE